MDDDPESGGRRGSNGSSSSFVRVPLTVQDLDVEDAESHVFAAVESRHHRGSTASSILLVGGGDHQDGNNNDESKLFRALSSSSSVKQQPQQNDRARLEQVAERVKRMNRVKAVAALKRKRRQSSARNLLLDIQEEDDTEAILNITSPAATTDHHTNNHPHETDGLMKDTIKENPYAADFDHHLLKAKLSSSSDDEEEESNRQQQQQQVPLIPLPMRRHVRAQSVPLVFATNSFHNIGGASQTRPSLYETRPSLPLHEPPFQRHPPSEGYIATGHDGFLDSIHINPSFTSNNSSVVGTTTNNNNDGNGRRHSKLDTVLEGYYSPCCGNPARVKHFFPRWMREVGAMCHPYRVATNCHDILVRSFFLWVGVPCLLASAVFYYLLDNPVVTFLPGNITAAWWLLFATRQTVTLGIARLTVYVLVDGFMLGTRLAVQTLGPLLTLIAATGKGWPLILSTWGVWNLVLMHGDHSFQRNWMYWTRMGLFNQHYEGLMLNSGLYTRVLLSAVLGGLAVSAKRTLLALRFGRKQFAEFKPRLERILADVVMLSEIATLAEEADKEVEQESNEEVQTVNSWDIISSTRKSKKKDLKDYLFTADMELPNSTSADDTGSDADSQSTDSMRAPNRKNSTTTKFNTYAGMQSNRNTNSRGANNDDADKVTSIEIPLSRQLTKSESGRIKIKDLLDSWSEPDSKSDKSTDVSIHDILKFRRALSHLDEDNIFGEAFGCTSTRDECIASSHAVYYRLMKLAPTTVTDSSQDANSETLPFEVLALLTLDEDGQTQNIAKRRMIKRMFTPDRTGGLPLLAFVQACDKIYKRLRYFRASIRNASVIDSVLERLLNGLFYFVLVLMLSSLLELNPWTLLFSITSLLVSVSFALGSSVSKYVEGILLIAIRRPYDLGDRIFMASAEGLNPEPDVSKHTWFVEDITLSTTTLRYAYTNEVATINNWSIAGSRIVNCARSAFATVHFEFHARMCILEGNKLDQFRSEIKRYVEERPRVWDSLSYIRHDRFDADNDRIDFKMALRHRYSWQESGRIKLDRSDLFRFLYELGIKLDVHFVTPPEERVIYNEGTSKSGDTHDHRFRYMRDRLSGANIDGPPP